MTKNVKAITVEERRARIEKARKLMVDNNIDAVFIESGSTLEYFTGISWSSSERMTATIIPRKGNIFYVCPAFEEERLRELISIDGEVRIWQEYESPFKLVVDTLKDLGMASGRIGIEEYARFFLYDGIREASVGLEMVNAKPVTAGCRMIKSSNELALMAKVNEITLEAYRIGLSELKERMSQSELDAIVYQTMTALGASKAGWVGSSFGKYSAFSHGSSQAQSLKEGDIVLIDGGCILEGYQADVTRTTVFGTPSKRQRQIWDVVKEVQTKVYEQAKAGVLCEHLDATARKVVEKAGFGSGYTNFFHRVGHGVGMEFHEWEYLVKGNKMAMQPGMCFSNEPGIYLCEEFGVRLEDCFYITEDSYQTFTPQSPSIDVPI